MRRRAAGIVVLALVVATGCGGESDASSGSSSGSTTTTTAPATTAPADPSAAVDEFCATTEELQELAQGMGASPQRPPTSEQQEQLAAVSGDAARMMMELQLQRAQMLPGDVARYDRCAALFGGAGAVPTPG